MSARVQSMRWAYFFLAAINPAPYAMALYRGGRLVIRSVPLAWRMAMRDLVGRYKGQLIGAAWTVAHPVMLMLIFLFIFGVVFKARLEASFELPRDYTVYILSGLVPWLACIPALTTSCNSILGSSGLVKQFGFDTTILPLRDVLSSIPFWCVGITFVIAYTVLSGNGAPWTYALLPLVLGLTFMFLVGLAWLLSSLTVFFRDVKDFVTVLVTMLLYILPIVYLPEWTPAIFQPAIKYNPLSYMIWVYQDVFYFGRIEHPEAWVIFSAMSVVLFASGYRVFMRLKPYFGNVL